MAVTAKLFGPLFLAAFAEEHNLLADTIKAMITTSAYTPDQDVHDYKNDVSNEVTGTNYTAGGNTLANDTLTYTAGTNVIKYDADDVAWVTSTITGRTVVVYNATGGGADASRGLIGYESESIDVVSTAGTWTMAWNAAGIFTLTVG